MTLFSLLRRMLRVQALAPRHELVQRAEMGLADATRVSGSAPRAVTLRPPAERRTETSAWASCPRSPCTWKSSEHGLVRHQRLDGVEGGVDGPVAFGFLRDATPSMSSFMVARCGPRVPATAARRA